MILTNSSQNKTLSDSIDETLKLQGVSYLKRTAIATFSLTLEPHHYTEEAGIEHIDVKQTLSGGFKAPADNLVLDNEEYPKDDGIVGPLLVKNSRVKVDELDIDFLKEEWTEDTLEDGLIYGVVRSETEKTKKDWVVCVVRVMVQSTEYVDLDLMIHVRFGVSQSRMV